MESDETKRLRSEIKAIVARGFAALKTMVDMLTSRVDKNFDNIAALRERLAALEERITNVKDDVTGQHHLHVEVARIKVREEVYKEIKVDEKEEKKLVVEKLKITAPVMLAVITGISALATGLINIILHLTDK